ncbi:MAG: CPBP family intramembrane metalloprotease [Christensenellaceae bacterium]|nr:CPBP family intramembrane metalloprotease [Christensenellaceae bacterium]
MTKLYLKNELTFSLVWIALYVVLQSVADGISEDLGTMKLITAPLCMAMTAVIAGWIVKNGLTEKYGLQKPQTSGKQMLFYLPLVVIASSSLWFGCAMSMSATEAALRVVSMLCVGFIEEIIFRGFLFKAISNTNLKRAVVISSVTFGLGHIVNLLNGAPLFETLMQIVYAVALGFLFTFIFLKSGSLIPCIVTHSAINSLSTFAVISTDAQLVVITIALTVISVAYSAWILRQKRT